MILSHQLHKLFYPFTEALSVDYFNRSDFTRNPKENGIKSHDFRDQLTLPLLEIICLYKCLFR